MREGEWEGTGMDGWMERNGGLMLHVCGAAGFVCELTERCFMVFVMAAKVRVRLPLVSASSANNSKRRSGSLRTPGRCPVWGFSCAFDSAV